MSHDVLQNGLDIVRSSQLHEQLGLSRPCLKTVWMKVLIHAIKSFDGPVDHGRSLQMLSQMVQNPSRRGHAGNGLEMTWPKCHFTLDVQLLKNGPCLCAGVGVLDQCKSPGDMVKPCKRRGRVCTPKLT